MKSPTTSFLIVITILASSLFSVPLSLSATGTNTTAPFSWNPKVSCNPSIVRISDITANQTGSTSFSTSPYSPGTTTTVNSGNAKRWLTPGPTPPGWASPGPQCSVTNAKGTKSLFVEIDGVERGSVTAEDSANFYDPTNGGSAHPTTYDNTFNVFDPSIVSNYDNSCLTPTDVTCYARIHLEIDRDWLAAGYCGTGTFCDPSALTSQSNRTSTRIDVQGFVYWDPGNLNGAYHQFNGWELHPLTAWKLSGSSLPTSISVSISTSADVSQVGQAVTFSATPSGGVAPYSFRWNFGDGATATGNPVSHMFVSPQAFTVGVTLQDAQGRNATAQKILTVGSWNSAVACVPAQTTLEQIVGNVSIQRIASNPNSTGADYSGGGFRLDGNLTYGSNPTTWPFFRRDLAPPCSVNGTPAFVEFHNVTVVGLNLDNCGTTYSVDNGGGPYPNNWQSCDVAFSLVTPGFGDDSTCPTCYRHRIYSGIDRDWNASGLAPPRPTEGERIDVQGFVFWNHDFVNASFHSYTGWEIHPVSARRPTLPPITPHIIISPANPIAGQPIVFNGTASGGSAPYNFTWDFGDGTTATGAQVSHTYPIGNFVVHVSAADSFGTTGLASYPLLVKGPPSFTISIPPAITISPGQATNLKIVITSVNEFSGNISLSSNITPPGPTALLNQSTVTLPAGGSVNTNLTISTGQSTLPGTYTLSITGKSGSLTTTSQVSITVSGTPSFTLNLTPAKMTALPGTSTKANLTLASFAGFKGTVQLNNQPLPSGIHLNYNPQGITLTAGGSAQSILTISLDQNTLASNYTLTITAQGGGITRKAPILLMVNSDFTIAANPASLATMVGTSKSTQINLKSLGFKGTIALSFISSSANLTATLSTTSISFNPGETHSSNLAVKASQAGTYTVTITATAGSITHILTVPVSITDFGISASPSSISLPRGTTANSTITLTSLSGFTGTVNLGNTVSPGGLKIVQSQNNALLTPNGTTTVTLTIASTASTPPGNYTVSLKATSGPITHTITITVTIS